MKPPTRTTRSTKSAAQWLKKPKKKPKIKTKPNSNAKWQSGELRNILRGLRQQYKSGLDDIDTCALQQRVPKRSVQEVESLLTSLKLTVARKVFHQVTKQRKNEQELRTPIQVWTELMGRIAGNHEDKISSAFSRMLVIAGTEPCNLKHSDPPRDLGNPSPATTKAQPISKPISKFFTICSRLRTGSKISSNTDARSADVSNPSVSCQDKDKDKDKDKDNHLLSKSPLSSSVPTKPVVSGGSSTITGAKPSPSTAQHTQTPAVIERAQAVRTQDNSVPLDLTASSATSSSSSSSSSGLCQQSVNKQGGNSSQGNPSQSDGVENTVDFEKIHTFLSTVTKDSECSLTAMESAVVLDLIMSLPEELAMLDCQSLQDHFLQVYSRLTAPVIKMTPLAKKKAQPTTVHSSASSIEREEPTAVPQAPKPVNLNWENVGICPLNPLMVPLSLLTRKSDKDS